MLKPISASILIIVVLLLTVSCQKSTQNLIESEKWCVLEQSDLKMGTHHTKHFEALGKYVEGFNQEINSRILQAIDRVQAHAMDGGGYFIGKNEVPTESPVFYNLQLFNRPLIEVPRQSSYCSGATYTAFIEAMNMLCSHQDAQQLSTERYEALRMQEPDGGRREDHVKFWGHWNADGFGNHFALVQYSQMGQVISPKAARPGDFVNISWKSGFGHSVIFLGWAMVDGDQKIVYWSSQRGSNGYGDQIVSLQKIKSVKVVRLTAPENIFCYDPQTPVTREVVGDSIRGDF